MRAGRSSTGAWRELRSRRLGMDTLIATSTLLAWGASTLETLRGGPHVWFDTAVMFVFVLLVARLLEQRARQRSRAHVDTLALARPVLATRETGSGTTEAVPLARLAPGDITRVAPGDTLPADGVLLDAAAAFDESLLTGESRPVTHQPGATHPGRHDLPRPAGAPANHRYRCSDAPVGTGAPGAGGAGASPAHWRNWRTGSRRDS